jgi:hypothetical protein
VHTPETRLRRGAALLLGLLLPLGATAADPGDPCAGFAWDVSHERALFTAKAQALKAGTDVAHSPAVTPDRLYELQLSPLPQVSFAAPPARTPPSANAYGGLATLSLTRAGIYRISLDRPLWVDVLADGVAIRSRDFQGSHGCNAPHKIVEFVLPAARLTLQFSGDAAGAVRVAVSRPPQPAP